jgi:TetR/AcrR family transcriptional regulator
VTAPPFNESRRGGDTRERILGIAETHFARKGYEGAHLERIASEVGVRKTALYYYFESKEALYSAVLERMLLAFDRAIADVLESRRRPVEQAAALLDAINDLVAMHRNYSQILIRIFVDRIPIDASRIAPIIERLIISVLRFYRQGRQEGVFRELSSRHVFQSVLGMAVFHYAAGDFSETLFDVDDLFGQASVEWRREEFRELLLRGVLRSGGE